MRRVTAAVIERSGKVLIARRKDGGDQDGKWEFPGGTVMNGETPAQCLARELAEELGLRCRVGGMVARGRGGRPGAAFELLVFRVSGASGPIRPSVHDEVRWVPPEDIAAYDLAEADARLLPRILKGLKGGGGDGRDGGP